MTCFAWNICRNVLIFILLLKVSMEDFRYYRISNRDCLFFLCIGIIDCLLTERTWYDSLIGIFGVSVGLIFADMIAKRKGFGGGDIKFMAASGALLGWMNNLLAFFYACISVVLFYPLRRRLFPDRKNLSLGPYLSIGIMIILLFE